MTYPGGKSGSGVYQTIINLMPKHEVYIEPFLGGGAVMKYKKPARLANIGIDADAAVIARHQGAPYTAICGDGIRYLADLPRHLPPCSPEEVLIYCDPPYLMDCRSSHRRLYRYELSDDDHRRLLEIIRGLRCMVMISGYASEMYDQALRGWRRVTYRAITRGGSMATEVVWLNYSEPFELHDYRYLGADYRERERIKRKIHRWQNRLMQMDSLERAALMQAIDMVRPASPFPALLAGNNSSFKPNQTLVEVLGSASITDEILHR